MSQRNVELLIGRLLTDEELRRNFLRAPGDIVDAFKRQGWELTDGESEALTATDVAGWTAIASQIPSRLRRCSSARGRSR